MLANYHTHTWRCNHASGAEEEYVQNAIDEIDVLLVKDPLSDEYTIEEIEDFFNRKFEELFGYHEYDLNFKWMDVIPPDENGKMRCFVCNVK